MFDANPLVPEARPIVLEAAQIFYKHLHPWLTGILVHGSAYKGGFIRKEAFLKKDAEPTPSASSTLLNSCSRYTR